MPFRVGLFALKNGAERHSDLIAAMQAALQALVGAPQPSPEPPTGPMPTGHVDTRLDADGLIWTPEGTPSADVSDAIKAWFPQDVWTDAARVSYYESGWRNDAERNTLDRAGGRCGVPIGTLPNGLVYYSEQSVGLFQINVCSHGHDAAYWRDPVHNVAYAAGLYRDQRWVPWTATGARLRLL